MVQKQNTESSVDLISPVGMRWLKKHRINCGCLQRECTVSQIGNLYVTKPRIDPRRYHPDDGFGCRDLLIRKGSHWLLRHRYKNCLYEDQRTGHGKLTISGASIPSSACIALKDSLKPLAEVVEIPDRCLASRVQGQVVSAKCVRGDVVFRFRIKWLELQRP